MRVLISGGPGAGCTSSGARLSSELGLAQFDSDTFFHKPTDPPFQEQYSPSERRAMLSAALKATPSWILSGSISTWGVSLPSIDLGIFLNVPKDERIRRLLQRERQRFGDRIQLGGDLREEHREFIKWAEGYDDRSGDSRSLETDRNFLMAECERYEEISGTFDETETMSRIRRFLTIIDD